jgi:hypothetical protein
MIKNIIVPIVCAGTALMAQSVSDINSMSSGELTWLEQY